MSVNIRMDEQLVSAKPGSPRPAALAATYAMVMMVGGHFLVGCGEASSVSNEPQTLKTTQVWGESGTQVGQFIYPRGMDVYLDHDQPRAVIVDKTARIQEFDLMTGEVLGSLHTPKWDRGKPTGLSVSNSILHPDKLAVYVADTHEHRVLMYELPLPDVEVPVPTEPDWQTGSFGEEPGEFIYPTDVAIETNDQGVVTDLYVSEYGGNDRISRFTINYPADLAHPSDPSSAQPKAEYQYQIGVVGQEVDASDDPLALSRPQSIELWTSPAGVRQLIVTDASHHRVGRITTAGELVAWYGDPLDESDDAYRFPYGITVLDDGSALITEFGANRVRCLDLATGETLWRYGIGGRSVGEIVQPWDAGVLGDQLIVLDSGNNRLQVCQLPAGVRSIGHEYTQAIIPSRLDQPGGTP
ncbi:MAG: hypothetical protein ACWA5W_00290 [Phycisphaerales bacterium]